MGQRLGLSAETVVIDRVDEELLPGRQGHAKDKKPVVYFRGWQKALVINNKVNALAIAHLSPTAVADAIRLLDQPSPAPRFGDMLETGRAQN